MLIWGDVKTVQFIDGGTKEVEKKEEKETTVKIVGRKGFRVFENIIRCLRPLLWNYYL